MSQFYYFTPCCGEQPFGIINNTKPLTLWLDFTDTVGSVYYLTVGSYSGCVTYSGTSTTQLPQLSFYNLTPKTLPYETCTFCTTNVSPCSTPPVITPPAIVGYQNECGIVTILPMGVVCESSPPSVWGLEDGEVSVSITGGTAPYTVTWLNNGNVSPALQGVGNGSYTATTVDFYGDYTATTVCILDTLKICTFSASIEEYFVEECYDNGMSGYTFDLT